MSQTLDSFLEHLRSMQGSSSLDPQTIKNLSYSPFLQEHELAKVLHALLCKQAGLEIPELLIEQSPAGAIPLFSKGYFPWGALPYPREHAEMIKALAKLGREKEAQKAAEWHLWTLDHQKNPLPFFFNQEEGSSLKELHEVNQGLDKILPSTSAKGFFTDTTFGICGFKDEEKTLLCTGSGCKSGIGTYLYRDIGIINFGPQSLPLGDCESFGLAGLPLDCEFKNEGERFSLRFLNRLAAPHKRETGIRHLRDASPSGIWVECKLEGTPTQWQLDLNWEGENFQSDKVALSFFLKAEHCLVKRTHKLLPASLNRYQGPAQDISIGSKNGQMILKSLSGSRGMEVIPLAGGDHFWGAYFLVAFFPSSNYQSFSISIET